MPDATLGNCVKCGKANRREAVFCRHCGVRTMASPPSPPARKEKVGSGGSESVLIPGGSFLMGSAAGIGRKNERPRHAVRVPAFYIDRRPVTVERYREFCSWSGRRLAEQPPWSGPRHPVVKVSWEDAIAYCEWAGRRLPTEAEWEMVARGGSEGGWCFGESESLLDEYAWFHSNSEKRAHPVGEKRANAFGVFDMHGNVWEWTADDYHDSYVRSPEDGAAWRSKGSNLRVLRGGSWDDFAAVLRSAHRMGMTHERRSSLAGFRTALSKAGGTP